VPGQTYTEMRPVAALTGVVSAVWVQHVDPGAEPHRQRHLPNGSVDVVCRVGAAPQIVGPRTAPVVDVLPAGTTVVGARLRPEAAGAVLGVPARELVDRTVDAAELWSVVADRLGDDLTGGGHDRGIARLLQRALLDAIGDAQPVDPVVAETVRRLEQGGAGTLTAIRSDLYVSERHLRRRIGEAVGLAPKPLQRMLRFQRFLAATQLARARDEQPGGAGLAPLAAAAGYADESHLNRECRRLTGPTAGGFLAETDRTCGCGHDHGPSIARFLGGAPLSAAAGVDPATIA